MKQFEEYFSEKEITKSLCRLRAKLAGNRSKKHLLCRLTSNPEYNYHKTETENYSDYEKKFTDDLTKLFPSRRKWKNIGKESRINAQTKQKLSAVDKNVDSLIKTIKCYRRKSPDATFLKNLDDFIIDIQTSIKQSDFKIESPVVYPKLKDPLDKTKVNKCRPISLFKLKDRITLSLTNRFLTELFDNYFLDCSFAFRATNQVTGLLPTHHDCIKAIRKYKESNDKSDLWSVECDIEKFYDSVSHEKVGECFYKLIEKAKQDSPETDFTIPIRIFEAYLNCYSFTINAYPLNKDDRYWVNHLKDKKGNTYKGCYGWVLDEFKQLAYYHDATSERIGVPQGGALSGLIANIVLDIADKEVVKSKVFYLRFCDDMIILHPERGECEYAKTLYLNALEQLKLVPHDFCPAEKLKINRKKLANKLPLTTIQPFWDNKSKGPYKWASIYRGGFPWIGFVGYELSYEGHIRVRKRSLKKEFQKQKDVVNRIKKAVQDGRRKSLGTITESAIHTLVGMSVGRVQLKNYKTINHEMCWSNGFSELTMNKYSIQQIKWLDRNRNKLYYKMEDELRNLCKTESENVDEKPLKKRQIIRFNKPFSYYYQVLERKEIDRSIII